MQIQWDEPATIQRPERVSPWDIEPFAAPASPNLTQQVVKSKRPRSVDIPTSGMWNNCLGFSICYFSLYFFF
jgi:auxin response factor